MIPPGLRLAPRCQFIQRKVPVVGGCGRDPMVVAQGLDQVLQEVGIAPVSVEDRNPAEAMAREALRDLTDDGGKDMLVQRDCAGKIQVMR